MLILSLESSSKPASVAVCSDTELLGQYYQNSGLTHSRTLMAMAEALLKNLDMSMSDIELIAVSRGPGSFTGIRIGVSAAKGLAWGLEKPVCGVSTLEAMARQAICPGHDWPGPASSLGNAATPSPYVICPVMDARRSQVYNALFSYTDGKPIRLCDDRAISLEGLSADLRRYSAPCLLIGDGALICQKYLDNENISAIIAPGLIRWQTAYGVALAALDGEPTPAADLEPYYIRPSQAELHFKG